MLLRRWAFEPNRIFWQCSGGAICLSLLQTGQSVRWSRRLDLSWTRCCLLWSDKKGRKQLPPLMISWAVGAFCCPKIECPVLHFIKRNDHGTEYLGRFKYLFWPIKIGTDRALTIASVLLLSQYRSGDSWRRLPCHLTTISARSNTEGPANISESDLTYPMHKASIFALSSGYWDLRNFLFAAGYSDSV